MALFELCVRWATTQVSVVRDEVSPGRNSAEFVERFQSDENAKAMHGDGSSSVAESRLREDAEALRYVRLSNSVNDDQNARVVNRRRPSRVTRKPRLSTPFPMQGVRPLA